ncbi:hypothetical protein DAPPUDRAFT_105524 [Daphnia pulex]|uniref:Uncharacterized protein n=1 Tax=Daphnia pulex TaxID=6669 RepID=E9GQ58_DAPPU|nr:hypothetical protein DAPPUDRAFT_105524 [Daphnia pulex]|eukprot:EFX78224.1 hypothetical protein DAPPUDRAFT_105524 [Daphnia pulex]
MAQNLLSCSLLYLSVTLIVMNIGFIDAFQSGSQNKQSTDDATKAKLDWLEEELNRLKNKEDNILWKAASWAQYGFSAAWFICKFEVLDGLPIVSGTKAFVCPYLAKKSSD